MNTSTVKIEAILYIVILLKYVIFDECMPYNCSGELVCFVTKGFHGIAVLPQAATSRLFAFPFAEPSFHVDFNLPSASIPHRRAFLLAI